MDLKNKKRMTVVGKDQIAKRVAELGAEISSDYKEKNLLVISLLKGSFIFTADLVRAIKVPMRIEFMRTSMYGDATENTGRLEIITDVQGDIKDYDILVVDDLTDTALTMTGVLDLLRKRNPRSLRACVLLDKPSRRRTEYRADYIGFEIEDRFIAGYGLNYGDYYRNEDHVFAFVDKD